MPATKKTTEYLRLARLGPRGEAGLNSYYYEGRVYKRSGLYQVDAGKARVLMSTGKFERVHPDDLERARREARSPRGRDLNAATRAKRREAALRKRRQLPALEDDLIDTAEGAGGDDAGEDVVTV